MAEADSRAVNAVSSAVAYGCTTVIGIVLFVLLIGACVSCNEWAEEKQRDGEALIEYWRRS